MAPARIITNCSTSKASLIFSVDPAFFEKLHLKNLISLTSRLERWEEKNRKKVLYTKRRRKMIFVWYREK